MPTKNPRVNVTFEENMMQTLSSLANNDKKSVSSVVRELAIEALELREDGYFSQLAESLDKNNKEIYDHENAWK